MIILRTVQQGDTGTYGMMIQGEKTIAFTCEDPWNDNRVGESCIPAGAYHCEKRVTHKYGHHWWVKDVPNRELILIHVGNYINDTTGCILVGDGFLRDEKMTAIGISNSKATMNKLREILPDSFTLRVER